MVLKTYVINLEKSLVRRQYMEDLLAPYSFLDIEFVKAVDGRQMTEEERNARFDFAGCQKMYGRSLNSGEIGCALSHRIACKKVLEGNSPYALILEDDISILKDLSKLNIEEIKTVLDHPSPRVLMLSGDYSYYKRKSIVRLYSAVGAYAYIINKAAANRILSIDPPCCVADDWMFYKRKGIKLYAVYPYMVDANTNMELLSSDVKQDSWGIDRKKMSPKEIILGAFAGIVKKLFKLTGHFESKVRIIDNMIVEKKNNLFK